MLEDRDFLPGPVVVDFEVALLERADELARLVLDGGHRAHQAHVGFEYCRRLGEDGKQQRQLRA